MKYADFKKRVAEAAIFSPLDYLPFDQDRNVFKLQVSQWKKHGLLVPLKKNLYVLHEHDRKTTPSRLYIANQLVFPSYVSLETALSFYGMIPERVYTVTSVTSKKTNHYTNSFGTFTYKSLQPFRYFGYQLVRDEHGMPVFIANKEKAFLDFLYFNVPVKSIKDASFIESFRIENLEDLDQSKLLTYMKLFRSKKLDILSRTGQVV
ncbi:hypothetical protein EH223_00955 [candidate division KSB1 bacterium]|nr:hypothetical protein [candidate division KSB1 bacterium]RQW07044.1 MAG: hypothetical protein EH223_00955 [candidate division KSB1 bacterium]